MESAGGHTEQFVSATGQLAVDVKVAAGMIGVCTKTLRREIERGDLAALRIGKAVRIRVVEIHAYLKRKEKRLSPY